VPLVEQELYYSVIFSFEEGRVLNEWQDNISISNKNISVRVMEFNATTFNDISVISWRSALSVKET